MNEKLLIRPLRACLKFIECCPQALFGLKSSEENALHQATYVELTHRRLSKERFEKLCRQSIPILQYLVRQTPLQFIHFKGKGYSTPILNPCCTFDLSLLSLTLPDPIIAADRVEKWKFDDNLLREEAKIKLYKARLAFQLEYNKAIQDSDLRYNLELLEILRHIYMKCLYCYLCPLEILFRIQLRWE